MKFSGEVVIPAPRRQVWENLMNEGVLMECTPGVEAIERLSGTQFAVEGRAKVGPVDAALKGELRLENVCEGESYTLVGQGKGAVGFVRARADVALHDEDDGRATRLVYSLEAKLGGRLAQLGSRLIQGAAQKYADEFFSRFKEIVCEKAGAEPPSPAAEARAAAVTQPPGREAPGEEAAAPAAERGLSPWIWVPGLVLVILALLYLWS